MAQQLITFGNNQESGWSQLAGASPSAINVVIDGKGAVRRRPAIQAYSEAPTTAVDTNGIEGIYCSVLGSIYAVGVPTIKTGIGSRKFYKIQNGSAVDITTGNGSGADLRGFARPVFAETEPYLFIAGGQEFQKITLATDVPSRVQNLTDSTAVPKPTFCAANAQRCIADDPLTDINVVRLSGRGNQGAPAGYENWSVTPNSGAGQFRASARPDPVEAIFENTNELFVFGSNNVQLYRPDDQIFYASVSTREYGVSSPYSVVKMDQDFIWLDHRRRVVRSDGRKAEVISDPIDQDIDEMEDVSDAFAYRVHVGFVDAYVITFPSEGRTFAYQLGGGWSQWQGFNETSNAWKQFPVLSQSHRVFGGNDTTVVGLDDGKVAQLLNDYPDDLGTRIKAHVETGYYNHETDNRKHCKALHMAFRRGLSTSTAAPVGMLSWSDQPGQWSTPIPVELGSSGDTRPVITFRSLGTYRRRAWRFTFSETTSDLTLAQVIEDFEVLDS